MSNVIYKPYSSENSAIEAFYANSSSLRERNLEKDVYFSAYIL